MKLPSTAVLGKHDPAPDQIWRAAISDQEEHELEGFFVFHWFLLKKFTSCLLAMTLVGKRRQPLNTT